MEVCVCFRLLANNRYPVKAVFEDRCQSLPVEYINRSEMQANEIYSFFFGVIIELQFGIDFIELVLMFYFLFLGSNVYVVLFYQ